MLIRYSDIIRKYNLAITGIIHVGAHTGEEASDYYANGVQRSIWVEANESLIPTLSQSLTFYPEWQIIRACVSDVDGKEVDFHISNNDGQSSSFLDLEYHKIAHPEVYYVGSQKMTTSRIDTIFADQETGIIEIEKYQFLNVDIQGAEYLALKGMGDLLQNMSALYLEVNEKELYKGCVLLPELNAFLESKGFVMVEKIMAGNTGWGDALFINQIIGDVLK